MTTSQMLVEARQAPVRLTATLAADEAAYLAAAERIKAAGARVLVTVARGTSDAAAEFLGRMAAVKLGLLPLSLPPSLVTLDAAPLDFSGSVVVAVSQSGGSPDLLAPLTAARAGGALTIALVNVVDSPLAAAADIVLPIGAGEERAVAASKSFLLSLAQSIRLVALTAGDTRMRADLMELPATLEAASAIDWTPAVDLLRDATWTPVVARGLVTAAAREFALKLKETTCVPAEALTAAEIMHGPRTLIGTTTPVLCLAPDDATRPSMDPAMTDLGTTTDRLITVGRSADGTDLGLALPPLADPTHASAAILAAAYPLLDALASERGTSPDAPRNLNKVTRTL